MNLKKLNLAFCLSMAITSSAFASNTENNYVEASDVTSKTSKLVSEKEIKDALLGCTTTRNACSRLAGQYGYPYYYAEVDYNLCYVEYPYACYGVN